MTKKISKKRVSAAERLIKQFATLFVNGPDEVRGNWQACENLVGQKFDADNSDVRNAIIVEGGTLDTMPKVPDIVDQEQVMTEVLAAVSKAETADDWKQLANALNPVIVGIAGGAIKATAAQSGLIRHILDRAYGRVVASQTEKKPAAGIIILPTLGDRANMMVCPRCKFELEQKLEKSEEVIGEVNLET